MTEQALSAVVGDLLSGGGVLAFAGLIWMEMRRWRVVMSGYMRSNQKVLTRILQRLDLPADAVFDEAPTPVERLGRAMSEGEL